MKNYLIKKLGGYTQQEMKKALDSVENNARIKVRSLLNNVKVSISFEIFEELKERPLSVFAAMVDYFCCKIGVKPFYDDGEFGDIKRIKKMLGD